MAGDLPGDYSDQEKGLVKENFSIVTPENCMKPAYATIVDVLLHPNPELPGP